jgi:CubicO group peptidase (beta-lactamase class C family)
VNTSISSGSISIRSLRAGAVRRAAIAVLAALLALLTLGAMRPPVAAAASAPGTSTPDLAAIDRYVEAQRRATRLPGLVLGIVHGDQVVHLRGFGQAGPSGRPVTPQTPFILASTTKSLTALAVMQLVEAGKVDLDAPVQRYLPWFRLADPAASARITVRHLLNQTSGLADPSESLTKATSGLADPSGSLTKADGSDAALEHAVRALSSVQPTQPAGQAFEYVNVMNYSTLGLIIQTVAGQSYEDYMRQHVLGPLAMANSYTSPVEARRHGLATGHRYWFGRPVAYQQPYVRAAVPAGFLSASAEAMTHHLIAQLNGGRYQTARVLSPAGIAQLHRPAVKISRPPDRDVAYAMGWFVEQANGVSLLWHQGTVPGFHADLMLAPQDRWGVVVLANGRNWLSPDDESTIARGVLGRLVGRQLTTPPVTNASQTLFFVMLGVVVLQVLGIARSVVLLRRWRAQPTRRPRGLLRVTARVVLPLLMGLAWALVCLVGLPKLGGSLREAAADIGWLLVAVLDDLHWADRASLLLTTPDLGWLLVASGTVSLVWGVTRAVLAVSTLRRRPVEPATPAQVKTVSA